MASSRTVGLAAALAILATGTPAGAGESWFSGDWYLTVGAAAISAPRYEGAKSHLFSVEPLVSFGRAGPEARFSSRNDNISIGFVDTGAFRAGAVGKIVFPRDEDTSPDLAGLDPVRWGGEVGGFAEVYPTDWLRVRGELRHGIRAHDGIVGDVAVDAFADVAPTVRLSGGPRLSFATADYFDAYYGVDAGESAASGLSVYEPGSGLRSVGAGGAVTWKATDKVTASLFGEYSRLMGPAASSSLVRERGSRNQLMFGLSTTYRFDFSL
jgi:outer membrane scaffolding protein for murein synthesis (MipA/OmpV family)